MPPTQDDLTGGDFHAEARLTEGMAEQVSKLESDGLSNSDIVSRAVRKPPMVRVRLASRPTCIMAPFFQAGAFSWNRF